MSKEYIEREAAVTFLENMAASKYLIQCFEDKEKFPTADVAPIVHGEWITYCDEPHLTCTSAGASKFWFTCSICGRKELYKEPYCHCGAKMDGGRTNA